jgi:hypothetical protein
LRVETGAASLVGSQEATSAAASNAAIAGDNATLRRRITGTYDTPRSKRQ